MSLGDFYWIRIKARDTEWFELFLSFFCWQWCLSELHPQHTLHHFIKLEEKPKQSKCSKCKSKMQTTATHGKCVKRIESIPIFRGFEAALIRTCPPERLRLCRKEDSALKCWPPGITRGHSDTEGRDEDGRSGRVIYTMPRRSSD